MKSVCIGVAASVAISAPSIAAPPPASAFGRIPAVVQAAISPDGQHVAVLGGLSGQRVLSIATIDKPDLPVLQLGDVEAVALRWAGDEYVVATVAVFDKAAPRTAYRLERNIAVDLNARPVSRLLANDDASAFLLGQPILGVTPEKPARVMVLGLDVSVGTSGGWDTRIPRKQKDAQLIAALFNVDPATGKGAIVEKGSYDTRSWSLDRSGQARVRVDIDSLNHRLSLMARPKGKTQYAQVWTADDGDPGRDYYGYSDAEDAIYLQEDGKLIRRRLADGASALVSGGEGALDESLIWDELRGSLAGIASGAEKPATRWLDPELGAVHAILAKVFKEQTVELSNWSADHSRFIVRTSSRAAPPAWYLFDKTRKELSPLGDEYPELKGALLGKTRWITYKARDGLDIPAYLTLPPGAPEQGGKLPLVMLPHGGPAARDSYDFDFIAQFLATRGYAVLQPQFRGSAGFGQDFQQAGHGEWGGKMQTDLLDGVAALGATGVIDPNRVCIVGASFGGYAALAGATLHPTSYRCAASFAGIADLGLLLVEEGRVYGRDSRSVAALRRMLGEAPVSKLMATSPDKQADAVQIPILLIHGDKDTVVPPEQSQRMAEALKSAGRPYELVMLPDENHYLTRAETRTRMLDVLEAFLAKNLPVSR